MAITHFELRKRYKKFMIERGHVEVPPIPLVPKDDPTTLFTGSGMQQFMPNLLGEIHQSGTRLFDIQPCIRAQDIEEVGDNRHTTSFEMIGNWSLGDYFKKEQIAWLFEFLTQQLELDPHKLFVSVFKGIDGIPADEESIAIWQSVFQKIGIDAKLGERIFTYDTKNWWSRAGSPSEMPSGEPGGPDSEVFYDFGTPHDLAFGPECHPNCDCGRFMEIGNSVFMEYLKQPDGSFTPLPKKNIDFGGGFERLLAANNDNSDVFLTDLYKEIMQAVELASGKQYASENKMPMRVIADHIKASTFLIKQGVVPSNKEQGYVLRRLLRRAAIKMRELNGHLTPSDEFEEIVSAVLRTYSGEGLYFDTWGEDRELIFPVIQEEMCRFGKSLDKGLKEIEKMEEVNAKQAFDLYQSYGFPVEITEELLQQKGKKLDRDAFRAEFEKHRALSRTASAGMFKGGLADQSEQTLKYHTATHLLHQALFDVLGNDVRQEGSNISAERLRFDFYHVSKPTEDQIKQIELILNKKIAEELPVSFVILPKDEATKLGAKSFFKEKYPDQVKVYYIGNTLETAYSKEFCGGPHVKNTKEIGSFSLYKMEKIGANMFRIYAR
ncbi:alanine--tRNA ligase [Candidatus Roizmanbacteria bacterium]|nr:alanine--tRNA ligase [Candidatus Roizmanbacteria bacterium]